MASHLWTFKVGSWDSLQARISAAQLGEGLLTYCDPLGACEPWDGPCVPLFDDAACASGEKPPPDKDLERLVVRDAQGFDDMMVALELSQHASTVRSV
jgi:hypothetical protein